MSIGAQFGQYILQTQFKKNYEDAVGGFETPPTSSPLGTPVDYAPPAPISSLFLAVSPHGIFTMQRGGEFPHQPVACHTSPWVTANAPPVFCFFQLLTRNMCESSYDLRGLRHCLTLGVGPHTHISSVGCFISWPGDECVDAN